jgi:hypothetical protein
MQQRKKIDLNLVVKIMMINEMTDKSQNSSDETLLYRVV